MERAFIEAMPEAEAKTSEEIYRCYAGRMDKNGITVFAGTDQKPLFLQPLLYK